MFLEFLGGDVELKRMMLILLTGTLAVSLIISIIYFIKMEKLKDAKSTLEKAELTYQEAIDTNELANQRLEQANQLLEEANKKMEEAELQLKKADDLLKEIEGELGEVSDENSDNEINAEKGDNDMTDKKKLDNYEFEVTDFDIEKLKEYGVPILLDFSAAWCNPCQRLKPVLEELYNEYKDKMIILYLDIDKLENGVHDLPVKVVPTQIFIDSNGNPYEPTDNITAKMQKYLDNNGNHLYTYHQGSITKQEMIKMFKEMGLED